MQLAKEKMQLQESGLSLVQEKSRLMEKCQINISQEGNLLTVKGDMGTHKENDNIEFLYRGIANRNFERKFELADSVKVVKADLKNGLLNIELEKEIPEHQKPRTIQINSEKLLTA